MAINIKSQYAIFFSTASNFILIWKCFEPFLQAHQVINGLSQKQSLPHVQRRKRAKRTHNQPEKSECVLKNVRNFLYSPYLAADTTLGERTKTSSSCHLSIAIYLSLSLDSIDTYFYVLNINFFTWKCWNKTNVFAVFGP